MKKFATVLILFMVTFLACQQKTQDDSAITVWQNLPHYINSDAEVKAEISEKMDRLNAFLERENLGGMLFTQVRNVYWITAGLANNQIVLNKDVGGASLLVMKNGKKYLICPDSEAGRMMDGSLRALGYELKMYDWFKANPIVDVRGELIKSIAGNARIGSDASFPGTVMVSDKFTPLRYSLTAPEMKRYRWLGEEVTKAVEEVCRRLQPGMDEYQLEAMTAAALRARGIFPTVLLTAVDQRIFNYRHALPAGETLKKYAMINVVAEKWGMPMAVTRFVHFGPVPEALAHKLKETAKVMAHFESATVPGTAAAEIFESCKTWYKEAGFEGEWKKHHQGGAIGYNDREYVIYPGIKETVQNNQAFAWNPTITGAKVEDTIIAHKDSFEVVTRTGNWPMIDVELNGKHYPQPDILVR